MTLLVMNFKVHREYTISLDEGAKEVLIILSEPHTTVARWSPLIGLKQIDTGRLQMFRSERDELVALCMKLWNEEE